MVRKSNPQLKKFQSELDQLLDRYGFEMHLRLSITPKGIAPYLVVDTPENMKSEVVRPTNVKKEEKRSRPK